MAAEDQNRCPRFLSSVIAQELLPTEGPSFLGFLL